MRDDLTVRILERIKEVPVSDMRYIAMHPERLRNLLAETLLLKIAETAADEARKILCPQPTD